MRGLVDRYPDVQAKCVNHKFPGRGGRETLAGDIGVVVDVIMLIPDCRVNLDRADVARHFARCYGVNHNMEEIERIIENRQRQNDELERAAAEEQHKRAQRTAALPMWGFCSEP